MAKKSWFSLLKRLFIAETHSKPEKEKRRRWGFGRKRLASVSAPSVSRSRESPLGKAEEEQSKHAVTVAAAAAEVVRLTGIPQSAHQYQEIQEFSDINIQANTNQSTQQCERGIPDLAATKIQTAFRGYLARKALRALKGVVRLQAIIRGRAVRRQATTTLRCLQSIVSIQSQVCAKKLQMLEGTWNNFHENKELQGFKDKIDSNSQRRWDDSMLSKDEANDMFLNKREAAVKRERIKEYSLSHRRSTESEHNKVNGRLRNWLEQWVDTQLSKNSDTVFPSNKRIRDQYGGQFKPRNSQKQYHIEGVDPPISSVHQRRFFHHKKQRSIGDDNDFASSSVVPTYMAATESAKAKARSMSSPRLRGVSLDAYSDTNSPYKHRLSPTSSIYSEMTSNSRTYNLDVFQQRSPCLKSLPGPLKSNRSLKDLSFDSECSLRNWDRNGASYR